MANYSNDTEPIVNESAPKERDTTHALKLKIAIGAAGTASEAIVSYFLSKLFQTDFIIWKNWLIAAIIVFPWLVAALFKSSKNKTLSPSFETQQSLSLLGIDKSSPNQLSESHWTPECCIKRTRHSLDFIGVLASKWINDPPTRLAFDRLLDKLDETGGRVRFILINPAGTSIKTLERVRGSVVSTDAVRHLQKLQRKHKSFRIKVYDTLPVFRLVSIDNTEMAVQAYHMKDTQYLRSRYGWNEPQLVLNQSAEYSIGEGFSAYFNVLWESTESLEGALK